MPLSGKQQGVMWAGLILVLVRMFTTGQGAAIWKVVSANTPQNKSGTAAPSPNGTQPGNVGGGGNAHAIST